MTTIDISAVVRGRLNHGNLFTQSFAVTRAGSLITVEHVIGFGGGGVPPPAQPFGIPLGLLPEGAYTVVYRARTTEGVQYQVQTLPLVVLGGAGLAVPAVTAPASGVLVVFMLALGLWGFRRYR